MRVGYLLCSIVGSVLGHGALVSPPSRNAFDRLLPEYGIAYIMLSLSLPLSPPLSLPLSLPFPYFFFFHFHSIYYVCSTCCCCL